MVKSLNSVLLIRSITRHADPMNRRSLIQAAAGVAASSWLKPSASSAGELSGKIRKAIKYPNIKEPALSITDKFRLVQDTGFDGVELRYTHMKEEKAFNAAREATGLPIHGLVNSANTDIRGALEFCAAVGGEGILITAPYDRTQPLMHSWKERQDLVRDAVETAERLKVKILVENVWAGFLISAFDAVKFVDEVGSPWFGVYFDVGNNARFGVPEHWIEILGPRIGKLDIKEWDENLHRNEGLRAGFSKELGEGTIDWAAVRAALKKIGYSGWATLEVGDADRVRMADLSARMDRILDLA